jgi:hypothetical protein
MNNRARLLFAGSVIVATACTSIIGVRDISYDANAEGGAPGDGGNGPEGSTPPGVPPGEDGSAPCDTTKLQDDANNCGACGHDCLGGKCTAGVCEGVVIATGLDNPTGIALDATYVYLSLFGGTILRYPKAGGAVDILATGQTKARGVVVDGTTLYWSNQDFIADDAGYVGGVWKCTIASCAATKSFIAGGDFAANVKLVNNFLYYAQINDLKVSRVAKTGGAVTNIDTPNHPFDVAADDQHIYYNSDQANLRRCLFDGGADEAFAPFDPGFNAKGYIIADGTRVYYSYTDGSNKGIVISAPRDPIGAPKIQYGTDNKATVGLALDATWLFWTVEDEDTSGNSTGTGGELRACKATGCAAAPISVVKSGTGGVVAVDDSGVYFGETGVYGQPQGKLWRVAKPLP